MSGAEMADIPAGFKPIKRGGAFIAMLGPLYYRQDEERIVIAMRIEEKHLNIRGIAHGGMLVTLADSALGIALSMSRNPPQPMVTVNLSTDFADSARPGDWVEAHVDIQRVGKRLAYANCYLHVGEKRILRASGVFALMPPAKPQESFEG
ncbi:MAG TPA: PaaI family thioesterase [Rhodocyclaceae bacterium]|nr:PaaI family thioesterase [Rhodocyclaceae bacterium]